MFPSLLPANDVWGKVMFSLVFVYPRGSLPACITGHMTRGSVQPPCRQTWVGGLPNPITRCRPPMDADPPLGYRPYPWMQNSPWYTTGYGQQAGGMHPTRMHSCTVYHFRKEIYAKSNLIFITLWMHFK